MYNADGTTNWYKQLTTNVSLNNCHQTACRATNVDIPTYNQLTVELVDNFKVYNQLGNQLTTQLWSRSQTLQFLNMVFLEVYNQLHPGPDLQHQLTDQLVDIPTYNSTGGNSTYNHPGTTHRLQLNLQLLGKRYNQLTTNFTTNLQPTYEPTWSTQLTGRNCYNRTRAQPRLQLNLQPVLGQPVLQPTYNQLTTNWTTGTYNQLTEPEVYNQLTTGTYNQLDNGNWVQPTYNVVNCGKRDTYNQLTTQLVQPTYTPTYHTNFWETQT